MPIGLSSMLSRDVTERQDLFQYREYSQKCFSYNGVVAAISINFHYIPSFIPM